MSKKTLLAYWFGDAVDLWFRAKMRSWFSWEIEQGGQMAVAAGQNAVQAQIDNVQTLINTCAQIKGAKNQFENSLQTTESKIEELGASIKTLLAKDQKSAALEKATEVKVLRTQLPAHKQSIAQLTKQLEGMKEKLSVEKVNLIEMQAQQKANRANAQLA